jgi:hypothetical protein
MSRSQYMYRDLSDEHHPFRVSLLRGTLLHKRRSLYMHLYQFYMPSFPPDEKYYSLNRAQQNAKILNLRSRQPISNVEKNVKILCIFIKIQDKKYRNI